MKTTITIILFIFQMTAFASDQQFIGSLGTSSKGQYVALEEYGYRSDSKTYYVEIQIMNVWKKEYVGKKVSLETLALRSSELPKLREKAKYLAQSELSKFKIVY